VEIKYSKKKQEMRKDPVFDFIMTAKDAFVAKGNLIMVLTVGIVLVLGGYMIYNAVKDSGNQKAQEAFGKALLYYESGVSNNSGSENLYKAVESFKAVVDNNKNSPQAIYSAYILGHIFLRQQRYDEAITWFNSALSKNTHTGFVGASALEGLAACFEAKGNVEESLNYLKKALEDQRIKYRTPAIEWKIALLSKDLRKFEDAGKMCKQILSDTTYSATGYKQNAENLLAEIHIQEKL
jgi:tetratricopeptide (TPR) repeat protein